MIKRISNLALIFLLAFIFCGGKSIYADKDSVPATIIVYGDTRTHQDIHEELADVMLKLEPDVIFHTGDCVTKPDDKEEWALFADIVERLKKKAEFYPVVGNHDVPKKEKGTRDAIFFDFFKIPKNKPWYNVDVDSIHFIILDSTLSLNAESRQYRWLEDNLKRNQGKYDFIIAIFHHPLFSIGSKARQAEKIRSRSLLPALFEKYGVRVAFSGHDHNYQRILHNGIFYIISGGGGGPLHDRTTTSDECKVFIKDYHFCKIIKAGNNLECSVYDRDLNILDTFLVPKK